MASKRKSKASPVKKKQGKHPKKKNTTKSKKPFKWTHTLEEKQTPKHKTSETTRRIGRAKSTTFQVTAPAADAYDIAKDWLDTQRTKKEDRAFVRVSVKEDGTEKWWGSRTVDIRHARYYLDTQGQEYRRKLEVEDDSKIVIDVTIDRIPKTP